MTGRPYDGVRVVEYGTGTACAFAGLLLADRGADVIKVEAPEGDGLRWREPHAEHESKRFQWLGRGKRSIVVDVTSDAGREVLRRLAESADVFLTNAPEAALVALGLDHGSLAATREDLVYVHGHGFGPAGEWAGRPANDLVIQAFSGMLAGEAKQHADGTPDAITCTEITQFPAGVAMSMGVAAALFHRRRTGRGQKVDTSDLAAALIIQGGRVGQNAPDALTQEALRRRIAEMRAARSNHAEIVAALAPGEDPVAAAGRMFYRAFSTVDGAVFMGALSRPLRDKIRRSVGVDFLLRDDPNFDPTDPEFLDRCRAFERDVIARMAGKTTAEWLEILEANGVPCAEVTFPEDLGTNPQAQLNDYVVEIVHARDGRQLQVAPPVRFAAAPAPPTRPAPALGEHTRAVLDALGFDAD